MRQLKSRELLPFPTAIAGEMTFQRISQYYIYCYTPDTWLNPPVGMFFLFRIVLDIPMCFIIFI